MKKRFIKPTIKQLEDYAKEIGFRSFDALRFWHSYERIGWVVGKNKTPMKSWRSAVWTWFCGSEDYKNIRAAQKEKQKPPEPEEPFEPADPERVAELKKNLPWMRPEYGQLSPQQKEARRQEMKARLEQ